MTVSDEFLAEIMKHCDESLGIPLIRKHELVAMVEELIDRRAADEDEEVYEGPPDDSEVEELVNATLRSIGRARFAALESEPFDIEAFTKRKLESGEWKNFTGTLPPAPKPETWRDRPPML